MASEPAEQEASPTIWERPELEPDWAQHLAIDAAYDTPTGWETTVDHDDVAPRAKRAGSARTYPVIALTLQPVGSRA